jgi:hypothetical protein
MRVRTWFRQNYLLLVVVSVVGTWFLIVPLRSHTQNNCPNPIQGNNAVYNPSCNPNVVGSAAFIDARTFVSSAPNVCGILHSILTGSSYPMSGAAIDARGLNATNTSMTCPSTQPSPWTGISNPLPSTILLPAGVISITGPWTLPDGTKIIGEGGGGIEVSPNPALVSSTTLQACNTSMNNNCTTNFSGTAMIQMCGSGVCHSVVIEDLSLDGQNIGNLIGISNANSQELSYVNRVNLYRILGYGFSISAGAQNSGPYSSIIYNTGGSASGTCAEIEGLTAIRGIHGLTCIASSDSQVAIYLDSNNTSLEDVRIIGFYDGVLIGSNGLARSNVLRNIYGDTVPTIPHPVNVIHIKKNTGTAGATDTAIMGVSNAGSGTKCCTALQV